MPRATVNGIEIEYESYGDPSDPALLLIHGLGVQLVGWDREFVESLTRAGYRVVIFDNRDAGLSTSFQAECPDPGAALMQAMGGASVQPPYTLSDMADDAAALLRELGVRSAHVLGVSLGGMVAQLVAVRRPDIVRSLTSVMSAPGVPDFSSADPSAIGLLRSPPVASRNAAIEQSLMAAQIYAGGGFEFDESAVRERAGLSFDRTIAPGGAARQLLVVFCDGDRRERLANLATPTLVIHGDSDPLIRPPEGRATADAIPGAKLHTITGMGHELPRGAWPELLEVITAHLAAADGAMTGDR